MAFSMPSVTALRMDLRMARRTQRHQVLVSMVAAFSQRLDVMHLLRLDEPAFLLAPLTKRVCIHIAVTDAFPRTSIFSFGCRIPVILFITLVLQFLMLLTESAVCQLRTAGVGTRSRWFLWHRFTTSGPKESPHRFAPMKALLYYT